MGQLAKEVTCPKIFIVFMKDLSWLGDVFLILKSAGEKTPRSGPGWQMSGVLPKHALIHTFWQPCQEAYVSPVGQGLGLPGEWGRAECIAWHVMAVKQWLDKSFRIIIFRTAADTPRSLHGPAIVEAISYWVHSLVASKQGKIEKEIEQKQDE